MRDHDVFAALIRMGQSQLSKYAAVDAASLAMAGGGGGMPPGMPMDPAMMMGGGGMPPGMPMDPAMMMGGGGMPMDPSMMMGGGGMPPPAAAPAPAPPPEAGAAGGGASPKVKVDLNVELLQIKKMLAKIIDALGIHIPAQDLTVTADDLKQLTQSNPPSAGSAPGVTM